MGFKILCQVGELDFFFSKLPYVRGTYNVLRGPAPQALRRAQSASLMGRMGRVGRVGQMGRTVPKSVLYISSYFVGI